MTVREEHTRSIAETAPGLWTLARRQPRTWLALDDDNGGWPEHCREHFVQTHEHQGISEPTVLETLKTKLGEMCK